MGAVPKSAFHWFLDSTYAFKFFIVFALALVALYNTIISSNERSVNP